MAFPDLFKLEKLKILAYKDVKRTASTYSFEAMFNPESISQTFATRYIPARTVNNATQVATFASQKPTSLNLKLLLDGTGVNRMGVLPAIGSTAPVRKQIDDFLANAYGTQGSTHEPSYLRVLWGAINFPCRLSRVTITYTSFDRSGQPLRAELDLDLIADADLNRQKALAGFSSPDVSHSRTVTSGDTLPLLAKEVYGSASHYLNLARSNSLNHFRRLTPGRVLQFPPLAKSSS
jgi:nucleoid-associated protein YgaU